MAERRKSKKDFVLDLLYMNKKKELSENFIKQSLFKEYNCSINTWFNTRNSLCELIYIGRRYNEKDRQMYLYLK